MTATNRPLPPAPATASPSSSRTSTAGTDRCTPWRPPHRHRPGRARRAPRALRLREDDRIARALGGLDEVDAGRILVDGKDVTHVPVEQAEHGDRVPGVQPLP